MNPVFRLKRGLKYTWQIWTRGWCDTDTWGLDTNISEWVLPRLKRFKELNNGYPANLSPEIWDGYLDEMIAAFEMMADDYREWDIDDEKTVIVNRGLDLFREYYFYLWW